MNVHLHSDLSCGHQRCGLQPSLPGSGCTRPSPPVLPRPHCPSPCAQSRCALTSGENRVKLSSSQETLTRPAPPSLGSVGSEALTSAALLHRPPSLEIGQGRCRCRTSSGSLLELLHGCAGIWVSMRPGRWGHASGWTGLCLPRSGQVSEQVGLGGGGGGAGEEKNEPQSWGKGQCSVGFPSGSKVAILMPPLGSLPSAGWEQLPLPQSRGPRASLYPCQTLNWPTLGEGSGAQGPIFLPPPGGCGASVGALGRWDS